LVYTLNILSLNKFLFNKFIVMLINIFIILKAMNNNYHIERGLNVLFYRNPKRMIPKMNFCREKNKEKKNYNHI